MTASESIGYCICFKTPSGCFHHGTCLEEKNYIPQGALQSERRYNLWQSHLMSLLPSALLTVARPDLTHCLSTTGVWAASKVIGTEMQILPAPRLPVLNWMFKGKVPSTHHATDATWGKWIVLIMQGARMGNLIHPGILEVIMDWPEGKKFGVSPAEEVSQAKEAPLYNELPENEKKYALLTDGSCRTAGKHRKWKADVWSPT
ncbi:uncharacterized protein LOC107055509 isoform X3 [Gallus gallus]|uniref:uncharacterized protein LOC107055509 isoform X3 n=1 Tax=Gallus gallus TaxID=9031 RepID=UPI001AE232B9|nr:uncharacterized protein LOC107055509 isoform X3 [Gallus gallus]XP_040516977.1 uncharacterized protein LOC107055508 isoform X3 [Gallus gallus]